MARAANASRQRESTSARGSTVSEVAPPLASRRTLAERSGGTRSKAEGARLATGGMPLRCAISGLPFTPLVLQVETNNPFEHRTWSTFHEPQLATFEMQRFEKTATFDRLSDSGVLPVEQLSLMALNVVNEVCVLTREPPHRRGADE